MEKPSEFLKKHNHSTDTTMKTVNTTGLMLGMLAVGGLIAVGAVSTGQVYAQPINAATALNSDDDTVSQSNSASIYQKSKTYCKAEAESENDGSVQVGDNTNTAANDCDTTQTAANVQSNTNTDNDVQVATAEACQAIAGLIGANVCGNTF